MLAMAHGAARPRIKYGACPLLMASLSNQLSREIPPELGNLENLKVLYLADNQLRGCVPSTLLGRLNIVFSDLGDLRFCS